MADTLSSLLKQLSKLPQLDKYSSKADEDKIISIMGRIDKATGAGFKKPKPIKKAGGGKAMKKKKMMAKGGTAGGKKQMMMGGGKAKKMMKGGGKSKKYMARGGKAR